MWPLSVYWLTHLNQTWTKIIFLFAAHQVWCNSYHFYIYSQALDHVHYGMSRMVLLKHILLFRRVRIKARSESSPRNDLKDKTNDGDKMWTLLCRVSETIFDKRSQHACALTESVGDSLYIDGFTVIVLSCYCRKELLQCGVLNPEKDLYLGKLALTKFPKSPETWIHR